MKSAHPLSGILRPPPADEPWPLIFALGVTQIISWGSMFYGFAVLMDPMQTALAISKETVVGAYCLALLLSGVASSFVGRTIDRIGGRTIMTLGSLAAATLFVCLSCATNVVELYLVWAGLGLAMAATLYDPAFAVVVHAFRGNHRKAITVLTLFGGVASTVFWPLTQYLVQHLGWRDAVLSLGLINLLICAPLHAWYVPLRPVLGEKLTTAASARNPDFAAMLCMPNFLAVTAAFTAAAAVMSVIAVHLLSLLTQRGLTPAQAAMVGALIGPMQVAGRIIEFGFARRVSARLVGTVVFVLLPLSLLVLMFSDDSLWLCATFAALYGISNGVMTIVRGTLPVELFGAAHYGAINGTIATPVLIAKASSPIIASLAFSAFAGYDFMLIGIVGLAIVAALTFSKVNPARQGL